MTSQKQVAEGGTAIQAGGDVIIHAGVAPDQIIQFLEMAARAYNFALEAEKKAEYRFQSFREEILKKFAHDNVGADSAAFRDPDFQLMLGDAQTAYVRSGDEALRDTLIDIIARRSLEKDRSRLALTLNEAVKRAPTLTRNELAVLSLVYLARYTVGGAGNFEQLIDYLGTTLTPFLLDLNTSDSCFGYIEAQGCGSVEIGEAPIKDILLSNYGGLLSKGFTEEALTARFPQGRFAAFDEARMPCVNDPAKIQFNARNSTAFEQRVMAFDPSIQKNLINSAWGLMTESTDIFEMMKKITSVNGEIGRVFETWDNSALKKLKLNSVGIAIAHANASRVVNFSAPLNIWIN